MSATEILNCLACGGSGYRVKWNNGRGRTVNCRTCKGTGKREPSGPKSGVHDLTCIWVCKALPQPPLYGLVHSQGDPNNCQHSCSYCEAD